MTITAVIMPNVYATMSKISSARMSLVSPCLSVLLLTLIRPAEAQESYANFDVAVYSRVYETIQMGDLDWLEQRFDLMQRHVKIDKVYLETHRDTIVVDEEILLRVKDFFSDRGVETSGGITLTINESNRFQTFCYSDPEHRRHVQEVVEFTAKHFDEVILDDFFFTSCKSLGEIAAKGDRSWTEYRLELLDEVARNVIVGPARAVNPNVTVIVKYPNWYEHFQGLGFNLETGSDVFDKLYTGTETRDATRSAQHLQQYHGYQIFRYFENLAPGHNAGGWVDTGGMTSLDRYAEQLWLTLFAKAPEITLFDFRQMQRPVRESDRGPWQGQGTSLDFEEVVAPYRLADGSFSDELTIPRAAGVVFEKVDRVLGELGEPVGVACYKPFHSSGEDFLHNFIGMIGIPIDLRPEFPAEAGTVFLTEAAKYDPDIVAKMERQLVDGKNVVITSGLLAALEGRGIRDIVELEVTERRAYVDEFTAGFGPPVRSQEKILIPQLRYFTNDSWELIGAIDGPMGWPLLHDADYANGHLYVLTVPDNPADLYQLPEAVLAPIRRTIMADLDVRMDGPAGVALFLYDNDTFIVESFLDEPVDVAILAGDEIAVLRDLETDERLEAAPRQESLTGFFRMPDADRSRFSTTIKPHSFRVFRAR
jgi:hypothetical protein